MLLSFAQSFSLRPTVTARPTFASGPAVNVKVTAILEKANAIRQVCTLLSFQKLLLHYSHFFFILPKNYTVKLTAKLGRLLGVMMVGMTITGVTVDHPVTLVPKKEISCKSVDAWWSCYMCLTIKLYVHSVLSTQLII